MAQVIWAGLVACIVSSVLFGSFLVPIKHFRTGDGMFVQFMMGCAIFVVAVVVNGVRGWPSFTPLALAGGALWATGNATAVPIVNRIGMTLGLLIWGTSNCFFGWASGRFGWFGMHPQVPESDWLNAFGLALAFVSAIMFAFVKCDVHPVGGHGRRSRSPNTASASVSEEDGRALLDDATQSESVDSATVSHAEEFRTLPMRIVHWCRAHHHKVWGVLLSIVAGAFYGLCFAPVIYVQDNVPGASKNGLDYAFSHLCGSTLACTVYFVLWSVVKCNRPFVHGNLVMPSFVAGIMWAVAQTSWFVANDNLSEAVSFPIITRMPGVVGALWGVFYFREIKGTKNLIVLSVAIVITVLGGVLSGLSKVIHW